MSESGNETRYRITPPKALLRGVSGPYFGKVLAVPGRLVIGRGSDCDLVLDEPEMSRKHAMIEVTAAGIYLRDMGSSNGTFVNGVQVRDAVLYSGDQIAFDRNRFLVEAPGMPTRADSQYQIEQQVQHAGVTQAMQAIPPQPVAPVPEAPAHAPAAANGNTPSSPWLPLLIGVAIAAALVLLLLGFRQS